MFGYKKMDRPLLDIAFERILICPLDKFWDAWTQPEQIRQWWAPSPAIVSACELDLREGGGFQVETQEPDGAISQFRACFVEVVPKEKLVWTNVLTTDYRPVASDTVGKDFVAATTRLRLHSVHDRTRLTLEILHGSRTERGLQEKSGVYTRWRASLEQMLALVQAP